MERLIMRGVMWGVDKVPDAWFDKIPGSYYKAKDENGKVIKQQIQNKNKAAYDDMKQKRGSRRRSEDYSRTRDDDPDDGYRSDGPRRSSRKKSQDGNYDLANDRPRRDRSRTDHYRADKRRPMEQRPGDSRVDGLYSYHDGPVAPPTNGPPVAAAATGGATAGRGINGSVTNGSHVPSAVSGAPQQPQAFPQQPTYRPTSTSTLRGGMATGYVPYANIYGGPTQQSSAYAPTISETGSVQPTYMNQVAPPIAKQPYHQNPYAQDAPAGNQPAYISDPEPRNHEIRQYDGRQDSRSNTRYDGDGSATERRYPRSHSSRRRSRRDDYSPSEDSYDSRRDHRRARSERRERRDKEKPAPRGSSHRYR